MIIEKSIAAATAVVGYDLLTNEANKSVGWDRILTGIALSGSAAALDAEVEVFVGNEKIANIFNKATGACLKDAHFYPQNKLIPANTPVSVKVVDAPLTNPVHLVMTFDP